MILKILQKNNLIISGPEGYLDSNNPRSDCIAFVDVKLN